MQEQTVQALAVLLQKGLKSQWEQEREMMQQQPRSYGEGVAAAQGKRLPQSSLQ